MRQPDVAVVGLQPLRLIIEPLRLVRLAGGQCQLGQQPLALDIMRIERDRPLGRPLRQSEPLQLLLDPGAASQDRRRIRAILERSPRGPGSLAQLSGLKQRIEQMDMQPHISGVLLDSFLQFRNCTLSGVC